MLIFFKIREKHALFDVISGFETELAGIQQSIKQLTTERDQITESYHTVSKCSYINVAFVPNFSLGIRGAGRKNQHDQEVVTRKCCLYCQNFGNYPAHFEILLHN